MGEDLCAKARKDAQAIVYLPTSGMTRHLHKTAKTPARRRGVEIAAVGVDLCAKARKGAQAIVYILPSDMTRHLHKKTKTPARRRGAELAAVGVDLCAKARKGAQAIVYILPSDMTQHLHKKTAHSGKRNAEAECTKNEKFPRCRVVPFINLHMQGGSTAAACFCLPLTEGA